MPLIKTGNIVYKALPLTMHADGRMTVHLSVLFEGRPLESRDIELEPADVAPVLQAHPDPTKSRYDDLSAALYAMLIVKGELPADGVFQ
jgi:hypothetical protein